MEYWTNAHFEMLADTVIDGMEELFPVIIGIFAISLALRYALKVFQLFRW